MCDLRLRCICLRPDNNDGRELSVKQRLKNADTELDPFIEFHCQSKIREWEHTVS